MKQNDAIKAIDIIEKNSKKRNFEQKIELIVTLRNLDAKKPDGQIDVSTQLPHSLGSSDVKSVLFAKSPGFASQAKDFVNKVIMADDIAKMKKKDIQDLLSYDALLAEGDVMVLVGRHLGQDLAPKGKMPKPVQPELKSIKSVLSGMVGKTRLTNKRGKGIEQIQIVVGIETMESKEIAENILQAYNTIEQSLPKKKQNIRAVMIKKTMGSIQKINN